LNCPSCGHDNLAKDPDERPESAAFIPEAFQFLYLNSGRRG
jgi:hypothetical protein